MSAELIIVLNRDSIARLFERARECGTKAIQCIHERDYDGFARWKEKSEELTELAETAQREADDHRRATQRALENLLNAAGRPS